MCTVFYSVFLGQPSNINFKVSFSHVSDFLDHPKVCIAQF